MGSMLHTGCGRPSVDDLALSAFVALGRASPIDADL